MEHVTSFSPTKKHNQNSISKKYKFLIAKDSDSPMEFNGERICKILIEVQQDINLKPDKSVPVAERQ
jgi:hypothetical protein